MSNPLRNTGITFFPTPERFLTEEITKKISKREILFYLNLWKQCQRYTTLSLTRTGQELAQQNWMADSQVNLARKGLVELGLIHAVKVQGGYCYTMCDPDSGRPISNPRLQSKGFDYAKLTPSENEKYFRKRLKDMNVSTIQRTGNGLKACCPLCKGDRTTFEVKLDGGQYNCHKCGAKGRHVHFEQALALMQGLEVTLKQANKLVGDGLRACGVSDATTGEPDVVYTYANKDGDVVFEVCRFPDKQFKQRTMSVAGDDIYKVKGLPILLYRLPEVMEAETVFIVEGEKDADSVHKLVIMDSSGYPIVGSTNSGGANKWRKEHTQALKGKRVICIGDNDPRGVRHMDDVAEALTGIATEVVRTHIPLPYKDVTEYLATHTLHELTKLLPQEWMEELVQI